MCSSPDLFEVQDIAAELVVSRIEEWLGDKGDKYDQVIIDCHPSISSLSLAALKAADDIVVPMLSDAFSLRGLPLLFESLRKYRLPLGIEASIAGVIFMMFPSPRIQRQFKTIATGYALKIAQLCDAADPPIRCLETRISKDQAYPNSFDTRPPLPFMAEGAPSFLLEELEQVASELGLSGGGS